MSRVDAAAGRFFFIFIRGRTNSKHLGLDCFSANDHSFPRHYGARSALPGLALKPAIPHAFQPGIDMLLVPGGTGIASC